MSSKTEDKKIIIDQSPGHFVISFNTLKVIYYWKLDIEYSINVFITRSNKTLPVCVLSMLTSMATILTRTRGEIVSPSLISYYNLSLK